MPFADDAAAAEQLYDALVSQVSKGMTVQIDVPAVNPQALSLVRERGLAPVFETARMVAGVAPALPLPLSRRFGVTSFELG